MSGELSDLRPRLEPHHMLVYVDGEGYVLDSLNGTVFVVDDRSLMLLLLCTGESTSLEMRNLVARCVGGGDGDITWLMDHLHALTEAGILAETT